MDPVTVQCSSACTVTLQLAVDLLPFSVDAEAGAQIAVAVAAIWMIGWAFRMLIRASNSDSVSPSTEDKDS